MLTKIVLMEPNFSIRNNGNRGGYVPGHWESLPTLGILLLRNLKIHIIIYLKVTKTIKTHTIRGCKTLGCHGDLVRDGCTLFLAASRMTHCTPAGLAGEGAQPRALAAGYSTTVGGTTGSSNRVVSNFSC